MYIFLPKRLSIAIIFILLILLIFAFLYEVPNEPTISLISASKTIVIDAGHGGVFPGKVSSSGIEEKDINLAIALKLQNLLIPNGAEIVMSRTTETELASADYDKLIQRQRADLKARTDIAKQCGADYFISIHCNSTPAEKWRGAQVFYRPNDPESQALAECLQNRLREQLDNTERTAIARNDTFLFENLEIPAVIVECGFLSNPAECALLSDDLYQKKIAHAIYLGLSDYLN